MGQGGNAKTIMIAALSPADINYEETLRRTPPTTPSRSSLSLSLTDTHTRARTQVRTHACTRARTHTHGRCDTGAVAGGGLRAAPPHTCAHGPRPRAVLRRGAAQERSPGDDLDIASHGGEAPRFFSAAAPRAAKTPLLQKSICAYRSAIRADGGVARA